MAQGLESDYSKHVKSQGYNIENTTLKLISPQCAASRRLTSIFLLSSFMSRHNFAYNS